MTDATNTTGMTINPYGDATHPSLGDGWTCLGTVTVLADTSWVDVSLGSDLPDQVALLQQTSATAYDGDGNVTATTDGAGRVTATTYDDLGNDTGDYQGQVVAGSSSWTFANLTPNLVLSYNVYGYSASTLLSGVGYQATAGGTFTAAGGGDADDTPLGANWYFLGTVAVSSALTLTVTLTAGGTPATSLCLLQQTTATAYDGDGNLTATIDAEGSVTASTFNDMGDDIADYQGQALAAGSGSATFKNLTPNYRGWYDVYTQDGSLTTTTTGTDPNAPNLGQDWTYAGEVDGAASLTLSLTASGANPAICLLQQTTATTYDNDGNATSTTDARGYTTTYTDNALGQQTKVEQPDPTGGGQDSGSPVTQTVYDADGNVTATITATTASTANVTATTYDDFGEAAEAYQGQVLSGSSSETFKNLTPNYQGWYDVYTHDGSLTTTTTGTDPNRRTWGRTGPTRERLMARPR